MNFLQALAIHAACVLIVTAPFAIATWILIEVVK